MAARNCRFLRRSAIYLAAVTIISQWASTVPSSDASELNREENQDFPGNSTPTSPSEPCTSNVESLLHQTSSSEDGGEPDAGVVSSLESLLHQTSSSEDGGEPDAGVVSSQVFQFVSHVQRRQGLHPPPNGASEATYRRDTRRYRGGFVGRCFLRAASHFQQDSLTRRLLTLFVTLFFTALAGSILLSFRPLAAMMGEEGIYGHLCARNETTSNSTASVQPLAMTTFSSSSADMNETRRFVTQRLRPYACNRQEAAVQGIYTYVFAASCVSSSLAGLLTDNVSPRYTAALGRFLEITGIVLIFHESYATGFALMAAGQQTAFLASLSVSHMFPASRSLVCGLLGSLASLSMFVPAAMRWIGSALQYPLRHVMLLYGVAVTLLATIGVVVVLPRTPTPTSRAGGAEDTGALRNENVGRLASAGDSATQVCTNQQSGGTVQHQGKSSQCSCCTGSLCTRMPQCFARASSLSRFLFSVPTLVLTLNLAIAGTVSSFFLQAADRIFLGPAAGLVQYFVPAAALPCILLGVVADRWGAPVASLIMAAAGLVMTSASFVRNAAAGLVSLTGLMLYVSALTSQVHWTSYEMFPRNTGNTVAGAVIALGGALSLVANVLYDRVALQMLNGDTHVVRLGLGSIQLLQLLLIFVTYRQIRRRNGGRDGLTRILHYLFRRRRQSVQLSPRK